MRVFNQFRTWHEVSSFTLLSFGYSKDFAWICICNFTLEWPLSSTGREIHNVQP
jgi:hypothetical protein